jgi:hypothetical protein
MRPSRLAIVSVCLVCGLVLVSGCANRRSSARSSGRVFYNVAPPSGSEYNPPAESTPLTPPAPGDSDPPPPTRNTSDLPPAPPRDDFESADHPGRFSAEYRPFSDSFKTASKSR